MSWKQLQRAFENPKIVKNIKWKRCDIYIIEFQITDDAVTNETRKGVLDARFAKFRAAANSLIVKRIYNLKLDTWEQKITHKLGGIKIEYEVGSFAIPDGFEDDLNIVCGKGVHFFNSLFGAFWYTITRMTEDIEFGDNGEIRRIYFTKGTMEDFLQQFGVTNPVFSTTSQQFSS